MAKQLLSNTENKGIDIAFHVGYDNMTNFYRCSKQLTGLTIEYRETIHIIKNIDNDIEDETFQKLPTKRI